MEARNGRRRLDRSLAGAGAAGHACRARPALVRIIPSRGSTSTVAKSSRSLCPDRTRKQVKDSLGAGRMIGEDDDALGAGPGRGPRRGAVKCLIESASRRTEGWDCGVRRGGGRGHAIAAVSSIRCRVVSQHARTSVSREDGRAQQSYYLSSYNFHNRIRRI